MVTNAFDQAAYWIVRHSQHPGEPRTVGNLNHSDETNIRGRLRIIDTAKHFIDIFKSKDILDIGCGFGDLCEAALAFGVHYTGIDISPIAIGIANTRYPQQVFIAKNVIEWRPLREYDLIFCVYTLSFIVSDSDWRGLLLNLSTALKDGGSIVVIDDIRTVRSRPASHVVARTFADYEAVSREVGLLFTQLSPGACFEDHVYPKGLIAAIVGRRVPVSSQQTSKSGAVNGHSKAAALGLAHVLPAAQGAPAPAPIKVNADTGKISKPTMLVLSWDMSHNPAARGYILADMAQDFFDVEFSGPIFSQFGAAIWSPLKEQDSVKITTFEGGELAAFFREAVQIVKQNNPSIVYVSKPRLPSFLIGVLFKLIRGTPFILDIDDHELAFCADATPLEFEGALALAKSQPAAAKMPFADVWTRLTETLIDFADAVTVSNPALQAKFGGILVRHARSEHLFSMDPAIRKRVRAEFSLLDTDIAIVFVGTPRPHKGILRIADALERLDNPNLVFVIVGSIRDARIKKLFEKYRKARIKFFPDQPWKRLSELVSMADMVSILQDIGSPITEFQIPAKLTDAIAMGIPVIATPVAPLYDLIAQGIVIPIENDDALDRALANAVGFDALDKKFCARLRSAFVSEFSYGINSARIRMTAEIARSSPNVRRVAEMREFVRRLAEFLEMNESEIDEIIGVVKKRRVESDTKCNKKDIVFFWKQNDSDIYGRRHDMMIKYLADRDDIRKILVFDRSLSVSELDRNVDIGDSSNLQQGNIVYVNTIKRILKMNDSPKIARRTFLYREGLVVQQRFGMKLPTKSSYSDFIEHSMREVGMDSSAIAWVCPVVFDFPEICEKIEFRRVVADLIDDQRQWPAKPEHLRRVEDNYAKIIKLADLVTCNCEPVREGFRHLRTGIELVPNGAEIFRSDQAWSEPEDLQPLSRPLIGYVGNLRDRIDIDLLRKIATRHPAWSVVLVGSAHGAPEVIDLARELSNIHLLGVRPYGEALSYIRAFDVAIMPHLRNGISQNMNPLKLYVYYSLGVPVVSTKVENIDDVSSHIAVAEDHGAFIAAIEDTLARGGKPSVRDAAAIGKIGWPFRLGEILGKLDAIVA